MLGNVLIYWEMATFQVPNVPASLSIRRTVTPKIVQCGPTGPNGHNVQPAVVEGDVREAGSAQHPHFVMVDTFAKAGMTMRKRVVTKR